MSRSVRNLTLTISALLLFSVGGYLFWNKNVGNISIPDKAASERPAENIESLPGLYPPPGFAIRIFAEGVPGARDLVLDPKGRILVSQTEQGRISVIEDSGGASGIPKVLKSGLNKPHGLAFDCRGKCFLYVAEKDKLVRFPYDPDEGALGEGEHVMDIASSSRDRHFTRSLVFLPAPYEDTLLVSVGSSCDVCNEASQDHASIFSYNVKTGQKEEYAKGLRNATFMSIDPGSGRVFATEMGRDALGDDTPPDEINIIEKGKNYGWPFCYGKNIHDDKFDPDDETSCSAYEPSFVDLQAHSAPLGLAFIPENGWPEEYRHDLLVAYHGSWNRSVPTGYKIVRIKFDAESRYLGTEDLITGWLNEKGEKTGRPVDIEFSPEGAAYISDDSEGVIYKLEKTAQAG